MSAVVKGYTVYMNITLQDYVYNSPKNQISILTNLNSLKSQLSQISILTNPLAAVCSPGFSGTFHFPRHGYFEVYLFPIFDLLVKRGVVFHYAGSQ